MKFTAALVAAAAASGVAAQSICDKYTTALLKDNTAANQYALLTLLVNTVVIGNYTGPGSKNPTLPGSKVTVPGILAPGMYNGEKVDLAPYFSGGLKSTNEGGVASVQNFLDGGGAAPIIADPTSSGTKGSNQYFLLTHLYQFFGLLLGCSTVGKSAAFSAYEGVPSMYEVHRFMDLDEAQISYFISQVGLAAASFGAATSDIDTVAKALNTTFGYRCSPPATVAPAAGPVLQAICVAPDCPIAPSATCSAYEPEMTPAVVSSMMASSSAAASAPASYVSQISDGQVQATTAAPAVTQISDGQVQATAPIMYSGGAGAMATALPAALAGAAGIAAMVL